MDEEPGAPRNSFGFRAKVASDDRRYYSVPEAAQLLGVVESTIEKQVKDGTLESIRLPGRQRNTVFVAAEAVEQERERRLRRLGAIDVDMPAFAGQLSTSAELSERTDILEAAVRDLLVVDDLASQREELDRRRSDILRDVVRGLLPLRTLHD